MIKKIKKDFSKSPPSENDKYSHEDLKELKNQIQALVRDLIGIDYNSMLLPEVITIEDTKEQIKTTKEDIETLKKLSILFNHVNTALKNTKDPEKIDELTHMKEKMITGRTIEEAIETNQGRLKSKVKHYEKEQQYIYKNAMHHAPAKKNVIAPADNQREQREPRGPGR